MSFSQCRAAFWMGSLALTVVAIESQATGLGSISVQSALGQQLRASIPVIGTDSNDLVPSCVKAKLESLDGVMLTAPRIGLERSDHGASIHLSTRDAVNEPALSILVELGCTASVQRAYRILLDPVSTLPNIESTLQPAAAVATTARAAVVDAKAGATASATETKSSGHARKRRKTHANTSNATPNQTRMVPQAAATAPPPKAKSATHNVLRMAPMDNAGVNPPGKSADSQVTSPGGATSQQAAETPAALDPAATTHSEELATESLRATIKTLQAEADALRVENDRMTKQIAKDKAALKSRQDVLLTRIQSLALLVMVFLIALIWLAWRFNVMRKSQPASWDALIPESEAARVPMSTDTPRQSDHVTLEHDAISTEQAHSTSTQRKSAASESMDDGSPAKYSHASLNPFVYFNRVEAALDDTHGYLKRDPHVKAEEVSDVMELVDVWMALHEPTKVLELLEPFNDVEKPESPLPWLCLLDVYSSLNDQEKYEAILWRITTLFNVKLAPWAARSDLRQPGTLADFPHVVAKILALWDSDDIGPYLDHLLVDTREGTRAGFNLSAYRDLARLAVLAKNDDRPRQLDHLKRDTAYAMLFAEPTPARDPNAKLTAIQNSPAETKPQLRVRPKYITTSYESTVKGKDTAKFAPPTPDQSHTGISDPAGMATDLPAHVVQAPPEHDMSSMNIKLRLAIAYHDMGDNEGARVLLDEVLNEGTPEQREQAEAVSKTLR